MTLQEILNISLNYQKEILYFFLAIPLSAWIGTLFKKKHGSNTWVKVLDSILIYIVSIPGILSLILTLYSLFIVGWNLLELNALLYFLPLASMIATFIIIQKSVWLDSVPWFGKISSLMMLIFLTFVVLLIFQKMFIGVIFIWNIWFLVGLFAFIFVSMKMAFEKITK